MKTFEWPSGTYAGYIFDCDGTLADTMPLHHRAWREALRAGGAAFDFHWDLFMSRAGMTLERTVAELAEQFRVELHAETIAVTQRRRFLELESGVLPITDVVAFARRMASTHPISVASGSLRPHVERTLAHIGARDLFEVIVTPEDVTHGKPDPEMFLLAAERMGVPPSQCLVFEDADLGIEAARRAGMASVRVTPARPLG
jgi:beta-phosphoglucomutase-like phosphatase (HAD superfamily)